MSMRRRKPERVTTKFVEWDELVAHEPQLAELLAEARSINDDGGPYFCNHEAYALGWKDHASFKKRIHRLVGFGSRHRDSILATEQAWDVGLDKLLTALPGCRNCGCVCEDGSFV